MCYDVCYLNKNMMISRNISEHVIKTVVVTDFVDRASETVVVLVDVGVHVWKWESVNLRDV